MKVVRIFLASANDLHEERNNFVDIISEISVLPALQRNYKLKAVQWERDAYVSGKNANVQKSIEDSVIYEELDIVIIAIHNRIGEGTRKEYEKVRELYNKRGIPKYRIMFRTPDIDENEAESEDLNAIKEELLREGTVTNLYKNISDFKSQLKEYIPIALLEKDNAPNNREVRSTITIYYWWTLVTAAFALVGLFLASKMSFPDEGVNSFSELYILVVQPVVFIGYMGSFAFFQKLMTMLRHVWYSSQWKNNDIYFSFKSILPKYILPVDMKEKFSEIRLGSTLLSSFLLFCALLLFPATQYSLLFVEMATWEVAVGHAHSPPVDKSGFPEAVYTDRSGIKMWLFGLQNEEAKEHKEETNSVIYVYAQGKFGDKSKGFRANLGDEVFLPFQGRIYLLLFSLSCTASLYTIYRLAMYRREFD